METFIRFQSVKNTAEPRKIYLFKVNNNNIKKRGEIWSKLAKRHQNKVIDVVLGVFIVNFEHFLTENPLKNFFVPQLVI